MEKFKGIPGPWEVIEHSWSDTSLVSGDKTIATISIYDEATEENQEELESEVSANFKLLSKAPEMLKMLCRIKEGVNTTDFAQLKNLHDDLSKLVKEATELP